MSKLISSSFKRFCSCCILLAIISPYSLIFLAEDDAFSLIRENFAKYILQTPFADYVRQFYRKDQAPE